MMNETDLRRLVIKHYNESEKLKAILLAHKLHDEKEDLE